MKRFIFKVALFFAIVAVVDMLVSFTGIYLQTHAKSGHTMRVNNLMMKDNHDVIIMGSSRAHHHYDTPFLSSALNMDVYNAGITNGTKVATWEKK